MNAPNATVTLPVIDDTTEAYIVSALETMYDAVRNYGKPLPPLADLLADPNGRERIVSRGNRALIALHEHRKEEKVRAFRQGVSEVVSPYIEAQSAAREQFLALPKEVRQFMPSFPTSAYIPLDAVASVFPAGTAEAHMVSMLHTLKYKVSKKDSKSFIVAELPTRGV